MLYVKSTPLMGKVCLLLLNAMRARQDNQLHQERTLYCFMAMAVYVLASMLPSILCSVRNRMLTTEYVQLSSFMTCNIYILLCQMMHNPLASQYCSLTLQFACLHLLYAQYDLLRTQTHVLLLSSFYIPCHCLVLVLATYVLSLNSITPRAEHHDVIILLASLFVGELLGCIAYVQLILSRLVAELYERAMSSFFAF